jgi:serum/glucocorticoid-regulated kinase 2
VVLAQKKDTGKYYAIKILKKAQIISENMFQKTLAEKTILQQNRHPFLVRLEYAFQTETKLYFVLEFMVGGELFNHLRREIRFPEARAKFYAVCIVLGMGFLHDNNYIYRDLKLENVLLDEKGYAVLTDFGFAKVLAHDQKTRTFCGTPDYVAPEILTESGHDRMVDWWALGVLIFEMVCGQTPFFNQNREIMYQNIRHQEVNFASLRHVSDQCKDLVIRLLNKNSISRLGQLGDYREILAHPWFSDINIQQVLERRYQAPFLPDTHSLEKNFEQAFLNENVRDSIENGTEHDSRRLRSYEKDFELLNFNKDSINK